LKAESTDFQLIWPVAVLQSGLLDIV